MFETVNNARKPDLSVEDIACVGSAMNTPIVHTIECSSILIFPRTSISLCLLECGIPYGKRKFIYDDYLLNISPVFSFFRQETILTDWNPVALDGRRS